MTTVLHSPSASLATAPGPADWLAPNDFELVLLAAEQGEACRQVAAVPLGPRDFLPMAHAALGEAIAARLVEPDGQPLRVVGVQAVHSRDGRGASAVRQWYMALAHADGELATIATFASIEPFAARACREAIARGHDPLAMLFELRRRRERSAGRLGTMTVCQDVPRASAPDVRELTLVGGPPLTVEPVVIWPAWVFERFAAFAGEHPRVEVLAAVLGVPGWTEVSTGRRILTVAVHELVLVPPAMAHSAIASVDLNREVAEHVRAAKTRIESRTGQPLWEVGTLHPHLSIEWTARQPGASPAIRTTGSGGLPAFFSVADRASMHAKHYRPYQVAMIYNVPPADTPPAVGAELAGHFRQWAWYAGTITASSGFYVHQERC